MSVCLKRSPNGSVVGDVLFHAIALGNQSPLENDFSLFVSLVLFGGELVNPAQLRVAVLAGDISHHMPARQHDPVLHFTVVQVNHSVEEEGASGGARESRANQLVSVRQHCVTGGAREQTHPSHVLQKYTTHSSADRHRFSAMDAVFTQTVVNNVFKCLQISSDVNK